MLPELPKKHRKLEADFGLDIRQWILKSRFKTSSFELKQTSGKDYLPFRDVKDEQIRYGRLIKSDKGVLIRTKGVRGLPDYIFLRKEPAWVVIAYPDFFAIIDIEVFMDERDSSKEKSLTAKRAKAIASEVVYFSEF